MEKKEVGWREEKVRDVGEHESGRMHALHASQTMSETGESMMGGEVQ